MQGCILVVRLLFCPPPPFQNNIFSLNHLNLKSRKLRKKFSLPSSPYSLPFSLPFPFPFFLAMQAHIFANRKIYTHVIRFIRINVAKYLKIKNKLQVVLLLSCFVGHPVGSRYHRFSVLKSLILSMYFFSIAAEIIFMKKLKFNDVNCLTEKGIIVAQLNIKKNNVCSIFKCRKSWQMMRWNAVIFVKKKI